MRQCSTRSGAFLDEAIRGCSPVVGWPNRAARISVVSGRGMCAGSVGSSISKTRLDVPGRPATDQQMRMYMKLRCHHPQRIANAKAGFSERTGRRIEGDPRLPSQKSAERPLRWKVADPLPGRSRNHTRSPCSKLTATSAECGVIRNAEIQPQQAKHAAGKCLSLPQGEVEHRSQHQHHLDRQIGINRAARPDRTPPGTGMSDRLALANAIEDAGIERSIERVRGTASARLLRRLAPSSRCCTTGSRTGDRRRRPLRHRAAGCRSTG